MKPPILGYPECSLATILTHKLSKNDAVEELAWGYEN
jgi:hypothetical protein